MNVEMDSDEKLPTPLNPNERNVYLNEPPLPVEFAQVICYDGQLVITHIF
jgi:hypothetical protein